MDQINFNTLSAFFVAIQSDSRIGTIHISLYVTLYMQWYANHFEGPVCFIGRDIMRLAKIRGEATYYRIIRQLHEYGYINYQPSCNRFGGSLVFFL